MNSVLFVKGSSPASTSSSQKLASTGSALLRRYGVMTNGQDGMITMASIA